MRPSILLMSSAAALLLAGAAEAQTIIAPTSAVVNIGGPGDGSLINTINQNGLSSGYTSGVTNFDAYLATDPQHTITFSTFEWFSEFGTNAATVTYDFGAATGIDRLALWNEESAGIGSLNLLFSLDGVSFTSLGSFTPTDNPLAAYGADVFSFAATSARYMRFEMSGCPQADPGSYTACAIGEVAFRSAAVNGAVPEPATWAMMLIGFGAIGTAARRRVRRATVAFA